MGLSLNCQKTIVLVSCYDSQFSKWNSNNKWWTVPYSENFLTKIKALAKTRNFNVLYEEEAQHETRTKISPFDIPNYKFCSPEYEQKLNELRYRK